MYEDLPSVGLPFFTVGDDGERFAEMNRGITPVFFIEPVKNEAKSRQEGRPIFDEMERVRLYVAGDRFSTPTHPVTDEIKARFAEAYAKFQANREERHISGTPLKQWPPLTAVQVKEFEALNIFNVEGLAGIADNVVGTVPYLREWRQKAKVWLEQAKDGAAVMRYAEENSQLQAEVSGLKEQIAELASRFDREDERRGPGRPRKDAA